MEELAAQNNELTIGAPKHCTAGSGGRWIAEAWRLFKSSWLEFLVAFVIVVALAIAVQQFRVFSVLYSILITPVLTAGFLMMAHKAWHEDDPQIADLFSGFRGSQRSKWMKLIQMKLLVSVVMALLVALLAVVCLLIAQDSYAGFHGVALLKEVITHPQPWMLVIVALFLVLLVFFSCALWLSTALLWFTPVGVIDALRLSLSAAGRNAGALTVFSLLFVLLALVALIPIGLGLLIVLPMANISTYVAFRQIFVD